MLKKLLCCVGPMKGGTTWLMWHLRNSEAVFFAPEKEIHYHYSRAFWPDGTSWRMRMLQLAAKLTGRSALSYSTAISPRYRAQVTARYAQRFAQHASSDAEALVGEVDQFRANLRWYRDYMAEPVDSRWYERLFGGAGNKWPCDFSATTCMIGPRGWKLLKRSAEDVRVIYFIRDPYERLWSHAKWHAMGRGEWSDFKEMTPAKRAAFMRRYRLDQHSLYAKRIKQMRATLGNDNVLVLNFDDIAAAPEELLRMVADFLQIPPIPIVEDLRQRHASSPELPIDWEAMKPFAKAFEAEIGQLDALGFGAAKAWHAKDRPL